MKVTNDILAVLSTVSISTDGNVRIVETLDRAAYVKVNKVLEACEFKWNRKAKAHVAPSDVAARNKLEQVMLTGEVATARDIGFFPTPTKLAAQLVEWANVRPGYHVLEPSAGTGRLVDAILDVNGIPTMIERNLDMRRALREKYLTTDKWWFIDWNCDDFLSYGSMAFNVEPEYDAVVMNPPFTGTDHIDHVRHAFKFLKPGGRLAAIMPAGVTFRQDRKHREFAQWFKSEVFDTRIEDLPENAFKESGTGVRTVMIAGSRPR